MHMADALLSPAVGGALWAAAAGTIACCAHKVRRDLDDRHIPLMGVLGAFVFAAQMINFTIPATGSSGHLGGGLLLAVLLGPHAALLTMASVLTVQALFFADGGLLALGCNIFNLGVFPCFVAYPLLFKPVAGDRTNSLRLTIGTILAAMVGLQLGALGVVAETVLAGISALPLPAFLGAMLPIHLAIGLVEGLVTAAVLAFVRQARPELLADPAIGRPAGAPSPTRVLTGFVLAAALTGGVLSWFASSLPDGLEWALEQAGHEEPFAPPTATHHRLAAFQNQTAFLPDYSFRADNRPGDREKIPSSWPAVDRATTVSGLVGGGLTLLLTVAIGLAFKKRRATD